MAYKVIIDSQEQKGWSFPKYRQCSGSISQKLPTGDYTLVGFEDIFTIERKGGVAEFAHNVVEKRFERELERLTQFKHAYVILEFELADMLLYPYGCLPKHIAKKCKYNGKFVLKKLTQIILRFPNIQILFCGSQGKEMATHIFKEITDLYE